MPLRFASTAHCRPACCCSRYTVTRLQHGAGQPRLLASTPVECWGVQCLSTVARQVLKAMLQVGPVLVCVEGQGEHMPALQHLPCTGNSEDLRHTWLSTPADHGCTAWKKLCMPTGPCDSVHASAFARAAEGAWYDMGQGAPPVWVHILVCLLIPLLTSPDAAGHLTSSPFICRSSCKLQLLTLLHAPQIEASQPYRQA